MPSTTIIKHTSPILTDLTDATVQINSQLNVLATATIEQTEDAELNRIADEREGGKRIKVSLDDL
ncbi:TPA: hypothetical protein ACG0MZ_001182 [Citrobacter farmeri]|uniref:hypothetical protein n=1 Tax=Citrobacter farmeri TaxID=67824 RepID=UPI001F3C62EA|nr:hypothetical protein [Citrobacter farmeri]